MYVVCVSVCACMSIFWSVTCLWLSVCVSVCGDWSMSTLSFVCVCVPTHVCLGGWVCVRESGKESFVYTSMYVYICIFADYKHVSIHGYIYIYTYVYIHTYMYIYMYIYLYIYISKYIYTYIYMYMCMDI